MNRTKTLLLAASLAVGSPLTSARALETPVHEAPALVHFGLSAKNAGDRALLAYRWAPIHYQEVDSTGGHALEGRADYVTRVDFDGDWNVENNWENAGRSPLTAHGYYSVVETDTHWFLVFMFYHPRDWANSFLETEHENDSEGVLFAIARDGSAYGSLMAAVTVAHADFFSFVPAASGWRAGSESVDGVLQLAVHDGADRPVTAQEARGHGLKAYPEYGSMRQGVVYYPSLTTAEAPSGPDDRHVPYRLVDLRELWQKRDSTQLFPSFGAFASDRGGGCGSGVIVCTTHVANPPWGWDDGNDGPVLRGELATDPVKLVRRYFAIPEPVSAVYTFNPYR